MRFIYRQRTQAIVRAALKFEGFHVTPEFAARAVVAALNEGMSEREWARVVAATMDRRYAAALFRTAVADILAASQEDEVRRATHVIIDSSGCRHREHQKWDNVIVSSRLGLATPFDWFCGCSLQAVTLDQGVLRDEDTAPSEHAIIARQMNTDGWMHGSPERFFHLA